MIGGNSFVANAAVIPAIEAAEQAHLVRVGSRTGSTTYQDVLDDPAVDVVYLPLPNGLHEVWTERSAAAGKHVLCEKPLSSSPVEAVRMIRTCQEAGVKLFEAWMTPFSPPWADVVAAAREAGVNEITGRFTFTIEPGNEANYRWDPAQGGGALLDVGIYALGAAVALWGPQPESVVSNIVATSAGVDLTTKATLTWPTGETCHILVSFGLPEAQELHLSGPGFDRSLSGNVFTGVDGTYTRMIDAVAADLAGTTPFPRPVNDAVAMLELIERIREAA